MTRTFKSLIVLTALAGLAGCAYEEPLQLPSSYRSYGSYPGYGSRSYSPYGVDPFYYYGYGMTDPFYYRYGYPAYGYYPQYPVHTCVDANRVGRCDRWHDDHDNDGDDDHHGSGSGPGAGQGSGHDNGRWMPPDRRRERVVPDSQVVVPDSPVKERPAPRATPSPRPAASDAAPRTQPSTPKVSPVAPRSDPRARDPSAQPQNRPGLQLT